MKSKLKTIANKISQFIDKYFIDIISIINCVLIIIIISILLANSENDNSKSNNNEITLCSMTTDNNSEDFNNTYSDYICLTSPIVKIGSSPYRCVGSLFLGYEGENVYLYYPVAYSDGVNRAYEYRRTQCNYGYGYVIQIACQYINNSSNPINLQFRFVLERSDHYSTLLIQDIYDINYFDYHCFVDEISPIEPSLNGYSTVSDYYCYASNTDYRFRLRLYNMSNLSEEPNTYDITDRYNPCLHFNDYSGYDNGYNKGYEYGYGIGEQKGEEYGMQVGFERGYSEGVISDGLFGFLSGSVENLLDIEIFPKFSIGDALWLGVGIVLFGVFMKIFRF